MVERVKQGWSLFQLAVKEQQDKVCVIWNFRGLQCCLSLILYGLQSYACKWSRW